MFSHERGQTGDCLGQPRAHSLRLGVDGRADEVALDPDEDRPELEAGERLLVGRREISVSDRTRTRDDPADQPIHAVRGPVRSSARFAPTAAREWACGGAGIILIDRCALAVISPPDDDDIKTPFDASR
ncbi:hypothetical protein [Mesorhizobium sp.]|uniref:hypothetical protein n=1 Tax=Mesorhizobium sp. TaxID=1871066 RepID=UPI0025C65899|nr:hypothetical protein [Mesorhizobium sp.]